MHVIRQGDMANDHTRPGQAPRVGETAERHDNSWTRSLERVVVEARTRTCAAGSLAVRWDGRRGHRVYAENREAMDAGAGVEWEVRHNPDELSALQQRGTCDCGTRPRVLR